MTSSRVEFRRFVADYHSGRLADRFRRASPDDDGSGDDEATPRPAATLRARGPALRTYAAWLRPFAPAVAGFAVLALVAAGLQLVEPLFLRYIVDHVLLVPGLDPAARLARLHMVGAAFLCTIVVARVVNAAKDYRLRLVTVRLTLRIRRALFEQLLRLPLPTLWGMKTGGILSRLSGDVDTTSGLLQLAVVSPGLALVRLIAACAILVSLNARLALTALAVIPGIVLMSVVFTRRIRPIYRAIRQDAERTDGRVGETFSGIRVVRGFRQESAELLAFLRGRHGGVRKELFAHRRELVLWTTWGLLIAAVNVIIAWYGGVLHVRGRASVGDIMAFQWYATLLLDPVWTIVNSFSEMQRALAATERVLDVLAMTEDKPDRPGAVEAPARIESLEIDGVSFGHTASTRVLHDITVTVPGGTVVALVGRSGAGKTTLTDLVARFHDPDEGAIRVDGIDLRDIRRASWRSRVALVPQEVFLFDGTIRENIAFGRRTASDAEIEDASRRANAHEFVERLERGYDTIVGERGVKLSGGQRQRLAIARALLAAPQVLILDEATSNLDTESEQLIQQAMGALLAGRTTFIVAHRLSTIRHAGLILVMEHGRIVERGTHDSLLALGGLYASMVERQVSGDDVLVS